MPVLEKDRIFDIQSFFTQNKKPKQNLAAYLGHTHTAHRDRTHLHRPARRSLPCTVAAMTLDAAILAVVVAFLLPLRLATSGHGFNAQGLRRSCATLALTAALFAAIFAVPRNRVRECAAPAVVTDGVSDEGSVQDELRAEVEQLKLQLARLGTSVTDRLLPVTTVPL
jgi:hypothetical protein